MSAFWASDRRGGREVILTVMAVLCAALAGTAPAAAGARDSTTAVRRVTVDASGVRVERGGTSTSIGPASGLTIQGANITLTNNATDAADADSADVTFDVMGHRGAIVVDDDEGNMVRVFADAEVGPGEQVDGDVVAVFGSAHIHGTVAGNVVAVFGSVRLEPEATVSGDVVAVGGTLDYAPGSTVVGEGISVGFIPIPWGVPALPMLMLTVLAGWLLTVFVGWLLALVFPARVVRVAFTASRRTAMSFLLGVLSLPAFFVAMLLLVITIVGIPVAVLLPVLYTIMVWGGQVAASYVLGAKLMRRRLGEGGIMAPILVGTLFVALFFVAGALLAAPPGITRTVALFFTLVGSMLMFALSSIGAGAFLLSRFGTRPDDIVYPAPGPMPAPSAPAPIYPAPPASA